MYLSADAVARTNFIDPNTDVRTKPTSENLIM